MNKTLAFFVIGISAAFLACGVKHRGELTKQDPNVPPGLALPAGLFFTNESKYLLWTSTKDLKVAEENSLPLRVATPTLGRIEGSQVKVSISMPSMPHMGTMVGTTRRDQKSGDFQVTFASDDIPHGGVYEIRIQIINENGTSLDELKFSQTIE